MARFTRTKFHLAGAIFIGLGFAAGLSELTSCGSKKADETTGTTGSIDFDKDVKPILVATCSAAGCHLNNANLSAGSFSTGADFKNTRSITDHLNGTGGQELMPRPPTTISAADKQKLLDYLAGK